MPWVGSHQLEMRGDGAQAVRRGGGDVCKIGKKPVSASKEHGPTGSRVAAHRQPVALDPVGQMPPAAPLLDLTRVLQPFQLGGMVEECGLRRIVESVEIGHVLGSSIPRLQQRSLGIACECRIGRTTQVRGSVIALHVVRQPANHQE